MNSYHQTSRQTRSITRLNLEQVFDEERRVEYETLFQRLWFHLVQAHDSHRVWEIMESFPIQIFCNTEHQRFLALVKYNFSRQVALSVINTLTDEDPRSLTFKTLKSWILENRKEEARHAVNAFLEDLEASKDVQDLFRKAWSYRSKHLAHFDSNEQAQRLSLYDMKVMLNQTEDLIQRLGPATSSMHTPEYSQFNQHQLDIEYFLCLIVRDFRGDQQPEIWKNYWNTLSDDEKKTANEWRKRAGLGEWK